MDHHAGHNGTVIFHPLPSSLLLPFLRINSLPLTLGRSLTLWCKDTLLVGPTNIFSHNCIIILTLNQHYINQNDVEPPILEISRIDGSFVSMSSKYMKIHLPTFMWYNFEYQKSPHHILVQEKEVFTMQIALITGAGRQGNLGFETAKQLGEKGYTVILAARRAA